MFGLFKKDPVKKLEKEYLRLMEEAMRIQRSGDIKAYAAKVAEAEEIQQKIDALKEG
ncbi:MAG: Lacal_2735 family protein [Phaeodactylibacter sp.]|nr:Lacal_2735 family protein [Phaeodactylibacter sp.]MCB9291701.1 Lacal_2735 family protein [Lewinellaceae bacterium]